MAGCSISRNEGDAALFSGKKKNFSKGKDKSKNDGPSSMEMVATHQKEKVSSVTGVVNLVT